MTLNGPGPLERATRLWRLDGFPSDNASEGPLAFLRLVSALIWRYKFTLVAATAIGLLAAAIYAQSLPRIYNATATLLLEPRRSAFTGHDVSSRQDLDLNSAESELQIIRSERLLSEVFESLGLEAEQTQPPGPLKSLVTYTLNLLPALSGGGPAGAVGTERDKTGGTAADGGEGARRIAFLNFVNRLNARRIGQSYVVEIEYSSTDPDLPARVANATASGYILQSVAFKEQMARAGTDTLQGRLDALAAQVHAAREAMESGTLPKIATPDADARIIGAALPPLSASSPRRSLIAALGGVLGLFIGMSAIAFKVIFDRRVRNANDLSQEIGIPCQASIPDAGQKTGIAWQMDSPALKAYASAIRDLRTSIEIACVSHRRERNIIVALIGSGPGTGASTLSFSLARLLSRSGRQVTVFFSSLHMNCGNASSSSASLADVALSPHPVDLLSFHKVDGVAVLPIHSKEQHANTFADFRHPRILQLLEAARQRGDVILDLPPLNNSMDALALASYADALLIVARANRTSTDEVRDVYGKLLRAGATVIGTVINRVRP